VRSQAEKLLAEMIAMDVTGSESVDNNLKIKSGSREQ
jgi:hypothetical protein